LILTYDLPFSFASREQDGLLAWSLLSFRQIEILPRVQIPSSASVSCRDDDGQQINVVQLHPRAVFALTWMLFPSEGVIPQPIIAIWSDLYLERLYRQRLREVEELSLTEPPLPDGMEEVAFATGGEYIVDHLDILWRLLRNFRGLVALALSSDILVRPPESFEQPWRNAASVATWFIVNQRVPYSPTCVAVDPHAANSHKSCNFECGKQFDPAELCQDIKLAAVEVFGCPQALSILVGTLFFCGSLRRLDLEGCTSVTDKMIACACRRLPNIEVP
jgi:hypothetical protein